MVLTRRQEQLLHTPPPAGAQDAAGDEATPATPADAVPPTNGRHALPLKSALKTRLRRASLGEEEATPAGAGLKKKVRIHSSSNLIHEFQASGTTDELLLEGEEGEEGAASDGSDGTPDSGAARPRRPRARRHAPASLHGLFLASLLGSPRRGRRRRSPAGLGSAWLGVLFTLSWMAASSALIFANKVLMVDHGFRFPCALTAIGQLSSMLLAYAATVLGVAPLRPPPSARVALTRLLPVSASFAASLFLGNYAYLGLSVAFINICKAATPLVTLGVGLAARMERLSKLTLLGTALIALGTAIATASEAASGHFHWPSFIAFTVSVAFEGIRVVMTERLLGAHKYNVMEALIYLGPFTFACLAAGSYLLEWDAGLSTVGVRLLQERGSEFAVAATISFLVNLFCYLSISHVSATTFKVAGCLKNVLVVWGGILQGDVVSARELEGYAISLAGFVVYSAARLRRHTGGAGQSEDSQPHNKQH